MTPSVLFVGPTTPGTKGEYIGRAFERVGWKFTSFNDWDYGFARPPKAYRLLRRWVSGVGPLAKAAVRSTTRRFLATVRTSRPDLILYSRSDRVLPQAVDEARQLAAGPSVAWFPDGAKHPAISWLEAAAPALDHVFLKDSFGVDGLRAAGHRSCHFLAQCCSRDAHRPLALSGDDRRRFGSDVAYAGTITPQRLELLDAIRPTTPKVWCDAPRLTLRSHPRLARAAAGRRVSADEQTKVFNASRIVLNPHRSTDVHGLNLRVFEAAGCRAFQLIDFKNDLTASFKPGKEIVCFGDARELNELVAYYLEHEEERQAIAERAWRRAHAEHTYEHRIATLLTMIGLKRTLIHFPSSEETP